MNSFEDRKKGFENKFALDEETLFKIEARRNKLLGKWIADKLEVIKSDMAEPGDEDVFKKVKNDLSKGGFDNIDEEIRNKMIEFMEAAKKAVL